jgi:integrase
MQISKSMNLTFKIILDKRKESKNGTYPVKLRVYHKTEYKDLFLRIKVKIEDWDDVNQLVLPTNSEYEIFNAKIVADKSKVHKLLLLHDQPNAKPSDIISALNPEQEAPAPKAKSRSIIKYGEDIVKTLTKTGKVGNAYVYSTAINKLKSFAKTDNFPFESLTYKKLVEFQDSLLADEIKVNTISVYMRTIRAVYNRAIKEGIVSVADYPFKAYRVKNEKTVNRVLTLQEIRSIATCSLPVDTPIWHWRNFFLLSFALIGINFSDLLTLKGKDVVNGRIVFRRRKTGKIYTIKLQEKAIELLSYYADLSNLNKDELLLPLLKQVKDPLKLKKDVWQAIKTCNEYLDRIAKKLEIGKGVTTYYARYTWANVARSSGYSKDIIGQALGHSYGNTTTSIYLDDYDNEIIDAANEKVIAVVFK